MPLTTEPSPRTSVTLIKYGDIVNKTKEISEHPIINEILNALDAAESDEENMTSHPNNIQDILDAAEHDEENMTSHPNNIQDILDAAESDEENMTSHPNDRQDTLDAAESDEESIIFHSTSMQDLLKLITEKWTEQQQAPEGQVQTSGQISWLKINRKRKASEAAIEAPESTRNVICQSNTPGTFFCSEGSVEMEREELLETNLEKTKRLDTFGV